MEGWCVSNKLNGTPEALTELNNTLNVITSCIYNEPHNGNGN